LAWNSDYKGDARGLLKLAERYEVIRQLGAGGMGVVYEATDRERGVRVALKRLKRLGGADIARFKNEFRALADVAHGNLVSLYELVVDEKELFFTMELVDGVDFVAWVRPGEAARGSGLAEATATLGTAAFGAGTASAGGSLAAGITALTIDSVQSPSLPAAGGGRRPATGPTLDNSALDAGRLRDAMRQLSEGVTALHELGVLHRDLKPSNVLVEPDGRVVVLDFGVVTDLESERKVDERERNLVGTPSYMSPEQAARQPLSPASDWYAVGVMLYVGLTARLPFQGGGGDILMDKQRFEPAPPNQVAVDVPDDLNDLCVHLLRRDPNDRPHGSEILSRLGSRVLTSVPELPSVRTTTVAASLVGRTEERAVLQTAFREARGGNPVLALVSGETGMGTSALLHDFMDGVDDGEALVLRGRCFERETVPFKAFDHLVDATAQHLLGLPKVEVEGLMPRDAQALARVFPVLRMVDAFQSGKRRGIDRQDPQELRRRAFAALRDLYARMADRQPLVLVIDDAHWGDPDSAHLMAELLRPPDAPAFVVVVGYRAEDRFESEFLTTLDRHSVRRNVDTRTIELAPLSHDDALELATQQLGEGSREREMARLVVSEARGNPSFIEELARYARERGLSDDVHLSMHEVLEHRLERLSDDERRLLEVVAVAGYPVRELVAFSAADVSDQAALSVLSAGGFTRVRRRYGERHIECAHSRVRDAVLMNLDPDDLAHFHRRLAVVLERSPSEADPEILAGHFLGAGELESAREHAERAAHRAVEALAFDRAAKLYLQARDLCEDPEKVRELEVARAEALANAGRSFEAGKEFLRAAERTQDANKLDLRRKAGRQFLRSGHLREGLDTISEVLESISMTLPRSPLRAIGRLLWERLRLAVRGTRFAAAEENDLVPAQRRRVDSVFAVAEGLSIVEPLSAASFQSHHLRLSLDLGEVSRIVRALAGEAAFVSLPGVKTRARAHKILDRLQAIVDDRDDPFLRGVTLGVRGIVAFQLGQFRDCQRLCDEGVATLENCHGASWEISTGRLFTGFCLPYMGQFRQLSERYNAMLREARAVGDLFAETSMRVATGFYVHLANDDIEFARRDIDDALSDWSPPGFSLQHFNAFNSRNHIDLYAGDIESGWNRIERYWPTVEKSMFLRTQILRVTAGGARGRIVLARAARLRQRGSTGREYRRMVRLARKHSRQLRREGAPHAVGVGYIIEAGLAYLEGNREGALAKLELAEHHYMRAELRLWALSVRRARGQVLENDEGRALIAAVDEVLSGEGVRRPDRVARITATAFVD